MENNYVNTVGGFKKFKNILICTGNNIDTRSRDIKKIHVDHDKWNMLRDQNTMQIDYRSREIGKFKIVERKSTNRSITPNLFNTNFINENFNMYQTHMSGNSDGNRGQ